MNISWTGREQMYVWDSGWRGVAHSRHGNHKGRVVGALYNIIVELNDLLDTRDWYRLARSNLSGKDLGLTGESALSGNLLRLARFLGRHDEIFRVVDSSRDVGTNAPNSTSRCR